MMKRFVVLALGLGMAVSNGAFGNGKNDANGAGLEAVRLGVMTNSVTAYAAVVGEKAGIFAKHGLAVETTAFAAGINTIDAITIGQLDIGFGADFAVLNRLGGSPSTPLRIFACLGEGAPDAYSLFARGADIKSPADLVGKTAVVQLGTVGEYWFARVFEVNGIDSSQVRLLPIDSGAEGVALLLNGSAVAAWGNAMSALQLSKIEGTHIIANLGSLDAPVVSVAVSSERFLREREGAAVKYLQAMEEIFEYIAQNPQQTAEMVFKETSSPEEPTLLNIASSINYVRFDAAAFTVLDNLRRWLEVSGLLKYPYELERYVDVSALEAAFPGRGQYK